MSMVGTVIALKCNRYGRPGSIGKQSETVDNFLERLQYFVRLMSLAGQGADEQYHQENVCSVPNPLPCFTEISLND